MKAQEVETYTRGKIQSIRKIHSDSKRRAALAALRRGVGREPGEVPEAWGVVLDKMPYTLYNASGRSSTVEVAIYGALTLYAMHQEGKDPLLQSMHHEGISLDNAVSRLGSGDERERIWKRFLRVTSAADVNEAVYYLRNIIQLLRSAGIGFDYGDLARDLYFMQYENAADNVRLKWGQAFFNSASNEEKTHPLAKVRGCLSLAYSGTLVINSCRAAVFFSMSASNAYDPL